VLVDQNLPPEVQSAGFRLPFAYKRSLTLGLSNLDPWELLSGERFQHRYNGLRQRYKSHLYLPFAQRIDTDDVACFLADG